MHGDPSCLLVASQSPVLELQVCSVQAVSRLEQSVVVPAQAPPEHVSPIVHASWSLHGNSLFTLIHPEAGLQVSVVHLHE